LSRYPLELNLAKKSLSSVFFISLFLFLFVPLFLPTWKLFFFAPFLVILFYQKTKIAALTAACLCGLLVDLFSAQGSIPFFAINYCLTTLLLYDQKQNFFGDSLSTLPIMVYFFGGISTLCQGLLREIFDKTAFISPEWFFIDAVLFPFTDACYGWIVFILPALLFGKRQRRGSEYFSG